MILKINGEPVKNMAVSVADTPLFSPTEWLNDKFDDLNQAAAQFFYDVMMGFLEALAEVAVQLSHSIALVGGGVLLTLIGLTGSARLSRWLVYGLSAHFLIQMTLG